MFPSGLLTFSSRELNAIAMRYLSVLQLFPAVNKGGSRSKETMGHAVQMHCGDVFHVQHLDPEGEKKRRVGQ